MVGARFDDRIHYDVSQCLNKNMESGDDENEVYSNKWLFETLMCCLDLILPVRVSSLMWEPYTDSEIG